MDEGRHCFCTPKTGFSSVVVFLCKLFFSLQYQLVFVPSGTHRVCLMAYGLKKREYGKRIQSLLKSNFYVFASITVRADKNNMFDRDTVQLRARVCLVSTDDIINLIMAELRVQKKKHDVIVPSPSYKTHFYALLNCTYPLLQRESPQEGPLTSLRLTQDGFCRCWGRKKKNYLKSCSFEANQKNLHSEQRGFKDCKTAKAVKRFRPRWRHEKVVSSLL